LFFVSLRYNYEFMAESRAQGNAVTLTLTKRSKPGAKIISRLREGRQVAGLFF